MISVNVHPSSDRDAAGRGVFAIALAAVLTLTTGCERTLENVAVVYPALSSTITLRWDLEATGVARVRFEIDGKLVGIGTDPQTRFAFTLDTRTLANGPHTLTVTALDGDGRPLRTVTSTILVENR